MTVPPQNIQPINPMEITLKFTKKQIEYIKSRLSDDEGHEWKNEKQFQKLFKKWLMMHALDLDLEDCGI